VKDAESGVGVAGDGPERAVVDQERGIAYRAMRYLGAQAKEKGLRHNS